MSRPLAVSLLVAAALSLPSLPAQVPCYAENDGPSFANNVSMGGPNLLLALKFQVPVLTTAMRAEVFTGEASGTNTLGIWSHDATLNEPLADLGTGSWVMSAVNGWQGADLPLPLLLQPSQDYWLVWGPVNGSQASRAPSGPGVVVQSYRGSFDGGATWNGPFSNSWKFRIYSTPQNPDFTLQLTQPGDGSFTLQLQGMSPWVFEGWTLISLTTTQPAGGGCAFGIAQDATTNLFIASAPLATPGNPIHWATGAAGFFPSVPFSVPPGTMIPFAGQTWDLGSIGSYFDGTTSDVHVSNVTRVTWP